MATFPFELVAPERLLFSGDVDSVVIPGIEGEMTILPEHAPVMTVLKPGIVTVSRAGKPAERLFVRGGFADVSPERLTLLADRAIPVGEFGPADFSREIELADAEVANAQGGEGARRALERRHQLDELHPSLNG